MSGMRPMMGVGVPQMAPMGGMPMGMQGQPAVVPMQQQQQPLLQQQQPVQPNQPPANNTNIQLDPFGA